MAAPSPEADSYGTVAGVAAYVGVYTVSGSFSTTTVPTAVTVTRWLDQVSDMFNLALANAGFHLPITQADAKAAITLAVEQLVADLCHAANSKGRLLSSSNKLGMLGQIGKDVVEWVEANSIGLVNLGVDRAEGTLGAIGSKGTDDNGNDIPPIFQRNAFGNKFPDWEQGG